MRELLDISFIFEATSIKLFTGIIRTGGTALIKHLTLSSFSPLLLILLISFCYLYFDKRNGEGKCLYVLIALEIVSFWFMLGLRRSCQLGIFFPLKSDATPASFFPFSFVVDYMIVFLFWRIDDVHLCLNGVHFILVPTQ